jgi:hypothetical protein
MSYAAVDEDRMKELFKQAILEMLEERRDWFYELIAEIVEDFALVNAIREVEDEDTVSREEVFAILEGEV